MGIVKTDVPMTAALCSQTIDALAEAYPCCRKEILTETAFGRPMKALVIGTGERKVLFTAAHHGNEWITAPLLLKYRGTGRVHALVQQEFMDMQYLKLDKYHVEAIFISASPSLWGLGSRVNLHDPANRDALTARGRALLEQDAHGAEL